MSDLLKQITELSPAKRQLLMTRLGEQKTKLAPAKKISRRAQLSSAAPLSFAQERIWFLDQLEPGRPNYNIYQAFRLEGILDVLALEWSVQRIVERHEVLRTTFQTADGKAAQTVLPTINIGIHVEDVTGLRHEERERETHKLLRLHSHRSFDLGAGPLLHVVLLRLSREIHVLLLVVHHIVFDGWSMGIFFREMSEIYNDRRSSIALSPKELNIQYGDYASWQREELQGEKLSLLLNQRTKELEGAPSESGLITDYPRPPAQMHNGDFQAVDLEDELSAGLRELARKESTTLFMLLLAAFKVLLWKWTGQEDIVVGTPVSGRGRQELEELIGLFVNTVVLRTDLSGGPRFVELLQRVRSVALNSYASQDLPFEKIVDALNPGRTLSRSPLFQVMFAFQSTPIQPPAFAGLASTRVEVIRGTSLFDLEMTVTQSGGKLGLVLEYDSDLFKASTIRRVLEHLHRLLKAIVAAPRQSISDLPLISDEERQKLLSISNGKDAGSAPNCAIYRLFEEQAAKTPDARAIEFGGESLSYRELNERSNQLAHRLRKQGAGTEVPVCVCLERSIEAVIALLGILKAGATYVPLDPALPESRMRFVLADTGAPIIVTVGRFVEKFPEVEGAVLCLDSERNELETESIENVPSEALPRSLAYIIYTSGTTGQPKGVGVEHRAATVHLATIRKEFGYKESDRVLQFALLSFDVSIEQMLAPLLCGAKVIIKGDALWDRQEFFAFVRSAGLTVINVPPAYWTHLAIGDDSIPASLRLVIIGGDAMPIETLRKWQQKAGLKPDLLNAYGPTETVITATLFQVPNAPGHEGDLQRIPIGRPLPFRSAYIVDSAGQLAPVGVWGELVLGGEIMARGYLNRPDLTAEKFVPSPFGKASGELLYRTGDQARWREDGVLEFLGRVDDQVKVRGYRIELGEVERAIAGQEKVEQAAVVVKERVGGERQLVAYVELESGSGGEEMARVRAGVRERLPEYMCPGVYVKLEKLPRSSSGKIDRRALAEMEWVEEGEGGYVGPGNEVEERLAGIWAGVLGRKRVGVRENFFELGGDSIVGIQIVARARQMGIEVTPKQLFQHQTIAELAAVAEVAEAWGGGRRGEEAEQGEVKGEAPLTPIQRWFFQQETDNVNYCNQAFLFVVGEEIRGEWVEEGLKKLVEQHDQLRARFKREGGEWKQWYAGTGESVVEVRRIDLSGEKAEEREARLRAVIEEEQRGLDIERGPLLRAAWIELGPERGRRLLVVVHHLGVDGVSWRIMLEDMESWYRQRAEGREGNLGLKTTSYKRWGEELERYGKSEELEREREYWEREEGREVEALPVDWGEGRNLAGDEKRVQRVLGEKATRELLGEAGRAYHTQVMELLVSALAGGLQRWRGQKRVRVEMEGHGREEFVKGVDVTRTVGWFTSVYPVVVEWREGEGTGERVKRVKEEMRRIPQKGMGYGVLKYVGEGIRKNKESELLVNYLGQMDGSMGEGAMLRAAPEGSGRSVSEGMRRSSKVELNAVVLGGQLHMIWGYSGKQYREETIVELAEAYEQSLLEVIEHCLSPEVGGFTPADFTDFNWKESKLDDIAAAIAKAQ